MASPGYLRFHKSRRTAIAVASRTAAVMLIWSPGALAAAGCVSTGQTIECTSAGTETITVPDGAYAIDIVVIGGGGGGGGYTTAVPLNGADGGSGAYLSASFDISNLDQLLVQVAAGGTGGNSGLTGYSAGGGGYSAIFRGATRTASGVLIVAGGGGGGAAVYDSYIGGSGSSANTAAGGNGVGRNASGGEGADGTGSGGDGGVGIIGNGSAGSSWSVGGAVNGGGGAGNAGGDGGDGYGGGGGGANDNISNFGGGGAGGSYVDTQYLIGSATFASATGANGAAGQGGTSAAQPGATGGVGYVSIRFYIGPVMAASSPAARAVNLDFSLPEGVACNFNSVEASLGSWVELPSASDCTITPRDGGEDPSLLGWATQEAFPVDIAQRQVDNGWGAYETFSDDGQLTGVFIPAGGYTTVTNDTNLYPIWR